jgi:type I restriction enzyme S subunit
MSSEWLTGTLGEYIELSNGKTRPKDGGRTSVYGSNGIIGSCQESNSPKETIVIGRVGTYCGSLHFSKEECWVTDNAIKAVAKKGGNSRYFYDLLKTCDLGRLRAGSGQPLLNQTILSSIEVEIPTLQEQKAIAHILGTLDDKIELNHKTNETLEAMAKALFKSWFVDFDPVRAKAEGRPTGLPDEISDLFPDSFEDSELGEIPSGWKIKKIGDIISRLPVGKRFDQKTVSPKGSIPVLDQSASGIVGYHDEEAGVSATKDFPLFTFANHTCAMRYMIRPFSVIQNVFPLRGNGVDTAWLYQASEGKQEITEYKGHYPDFIEKQVVVPVNGIDKIYGGDYERILIKCDFNLINSEFLASIRDALLPKLISGEIRIPDAEKMLEEVGV